LYETVQAFLGKITKSIICYVATGENDISELGEPSVPRYDEFLTPSMSTIMNTGPSALPSTSACIIADSGTPKTAKRQLDDRDKEILFDKNESKTGKVFYLISSLCIVLIH